MSGEAPTDPMATRTAAPRTSTGGHASETLTDAERIEAATTVGRFTILSVVGAGGMGQVYAAYDPQLDRRVALKLLHTPDDELAKRRLVREAQALARLSHPNVVGVHEVGSHDGRVFVAMEFVDGETLKAWAHANPPGEPDRQRRALELLIHAARGLAAAHEAGLVHRDVKPGNILVGRDGRVRVADFGLARADEEAPAPAEALEASLSSSQSEGALVGAALTRTGMIAGTPAYMAPEQLTSEPVSAATDQFGFCVTAWEVLYGRRPFELGAIVALLQAILDGRIERPASVDVPPAVEAALRRGLAYRPKKRHRSMDALVAMLEEELRRIDGLPATRRRRSWWAAGIAVAAVAAALGVWSMRSDGPSCRADPSSFAGVWDDTRKSSIEEAILGTQAGFARETWSRLAPAIDDWRDDWLAARTQACEATHVRGEQSAELLDLRMACLEDRRMHLQAFLDVLAEGRVDAIAEADDAFAELPSIARCGDAEYLRRSSTQPDDPALAGRIVTVERTMAEAAARLAAGDYDHARAVAEAAAHEATALGDDRTEARARLVLGKIRFELQQFADAEAELASAYLLARRADDRETAAQTTRLMLNVTGVAQQRYADGRWWANLAEIEARRSDDEISVLRAQAAEARLLSAEGDNRGAIEAVEAVLAALPVGEPAVELLRGQTSLQLGDLLVSSGENARGREVLSDALRIMSSRLGPAHPSIATVHVRLSRARRLAGDLEGSRKEIERALEIAERALGSRHVLLRPILDERADVRWAHGDLEGTLDDLERALKLDVPHPLRPLSVAMLLSREGNTWLGARRPDKAEPVLRRALSIMREELGERHYSTARQRVALAAVLGASGRRAEADEELAEALALGEQLLGRDHPEMAVVHDEISMIRLQAGDLDDALRHSRRSLEIVKRTEGEDGIEVVRAEANMCEILEKVGRASEAVSHCEAGIALARRVEGVDPEIIANLENNLGAALVPLGRLDEAAEYYQRAHDVWAERFGAESPHVGIALANLAEVRERASDPEGARALYVRSLAVREHAAGTSDSSLVVPLLGLARVALATEDPDAALAAARRAVGICEANPTPPSTTALAREQLALALFQSGRPRDGTREARRALEALQAAGPRAAADEARIRAWIDEAGRR